MDSLFVYRRGAKKLQGGRSAGDKKYEMGDKELGDGFRRKKKHWDMSFASRVKYVRPFSHRFTTGLV
jgi:hypothetical protein